MDPKEYLEKFLATRQLDLSNRDILMAAFCNNEQYLSAARRILELQDMLMKEFIRKNRIEDIRRQQVMIPNGTVGKSYAAQIDPAQYGWDDMTERMLEGLDATGLEYDPATGTIGGVPQQPGDFRLLLKYKLEGDEAEEALHEKIIPLIINPDPRTLWKENVADPEAPFQKENEASLSMPMGDRQLVAASVRGRSHANAGLFRDDDFAAKYFSDTGWSLIAVSDGAGSARYAREGARIACESVLGYFEQKLEAGVFNELDQLLETLNKEATTGNQQQVSHFLYHQLGGAARYALSRIEVQARDSEASLKDFHATLIFVLAKKYEFGYVVLSFGVGDCPAGLVYNGGTAVHLLNTLDVGEFGGGTRFITMPEIFQAENFANRLGIKIVNNFDYLVLMTDGIYDPKFEVEANLVKPDRWQAFIEDLKGNNEDRLAVHLNPDNAAIATELLNWMAFWSPGNHDDRTLAILF